MIGGQEMDIYEQLNVPKVINGYDTMTYLGGSVMPAEVVEAMVEASRYFVDMHLLHQRVGEAIANLTNNEAALVCGGAAAGLALATAACIAGDEPGLIERLPDTRGQKNEVIIHRCQRNAYDHAIRQAGAKLVGVGYYDHTSRAQLEAAFTPNTAAIFYFCGTTFEAGALPLEEVLEVAQARNVPVIVDAAAQLPPVENLWRYTKMGAKLVIFSGGKGLRGPQGSGLIVGAKDYVRKCALNGCPNYGIGRSMKTGKEDVIGLYAAIKRFVSLDHHKELQEMEKIVDAVFQAVENIPHINWRREFPARLGQTYPRAVITLMEGFPASREQVLQDLRQGNPRIELGSYEKDDSSIYVNPLTLSVSQAVVVAHRLRGTLLRFVNE
jgi:L-seryl-tRNA(Ser) seleniumtransferase